MKKMILIVSYFISSFFKSIFKNSPSFFKLASTDISQEKLSRIYHKLILSDAIVMSKSDICVKLKHICNSAKVQDKVITDLVNDRLLVMGKWFSLKNINGIVDYAGYLKGFPGNDTQAQIEFATVLAKYAIDYVDFEKSFKKNKVDDFPRKIDVTDIKKSKWLFSQALRETILANNFLKQRLVIDSSAFIQSSNSKSI